MNCNGAGTGIEYYNPMLEVDHGRADMRVLLKYESNRYVGDCGQRLSEKSHVELITKVNG